LAGDATGSATAAAFSAVPAMPKTSDFLGLPRRRFMRSTSDGESALNIASGLGSMFRFYKYFRPKTLRFSFKKLLFNMKNVIIT
jgi:hypothetical protein